MQTSLFVYGSFCRGMVHHGLIANFIEDTKSVHALGSVYRLEVGYPVYLTEGQCRIPGELVTINSPTLLSILDQFHGYSSIQPDKSLHIRNQIEVFDANSSYTAVTYTINPKKLPKTALIIADGNWPDDFEKTPPKTTSLTDREKTYILKLSQSSGRDIVPIQLDLYRSLLNQGIIVDKGRRLALTRYGLELSRYLK